MGFGYDTRQVSGGHEMLAEIDIDDIMIDTVDTNEFADARIESWETYKKDLSEVDYVEWWGATVPLQYTDTIWEV